MKNKIIKILIVFGTRPEAIKLCSLIKEFEKHEDTFETRVCATAQHREMLDQVLELFSIKPHYDLDIMKQGQDLFEITSEVLSGMKDVLDDFNPDFVIVQGDTTTAFVTALAAYYQKIPIGHVEAGLRTGNIYSPWPEEVNRCLVGQIAKIHFAPTELSKQNLLMENKSKEDIFVTGNTVIDALNIVVRGQGKGGSGQLSGISCQGSENIERYFKKKWGLTVCNDSGNSKLILVTGHRRESFGEGFKKICNALSILAKNNHEIQIVYPVHLNPNVQEPVYSILGDVNNIHLIPPLDYEPFVFLMNRSYLILTDSGGIQEEAPSLGVPVLVMRDTSERPEGIEAGSARLVGTDVETIVAETQKLLDSNDEYKCMSTAINPYGDGNASKRIVEIISEHLGKNI